MTMLTETLLAVSTAFVLHQVHSFYRIRSKISNIPTVGSDHFLLSYFYAWKFFFNGDRSIKEGYIMYPGSVFKVPDLVTSTRWTIVVNGEQLVEDIRKAPDDVLSFSQTTVDFLQTEYLFGHHSGASDFQVGVVRSPLTRAFPGRFAEIQDEIAESCKDYLPTGNDWEGRRIHRQLIHIVCRTTNRFFVGLPLCREPEWRQVQEDWTIQVIVSANILHLIPSIFKPAAGYFLSKARSASKKVEKFVGPIISERLEKDALYGPNWEGKPNDLISWLMDLAPPEHRNVEDITFRVMLINFAAIHTTSLTLTNVLFDLAARQEYIKPLREEIEEVTRNYGWTKDGMGRMRKVDSFMKESSRMGGIGSISLGRKAAKDFTLSNGVTIPAGYTVAAASSGIHYDPNIYDDPETFNGFRFSDMREKGTNEYDPLRHQMISLDSTYLLFGHGRHACPGRFFAVNEVKAMMAYILINYDIKLPGDATEVPAGMWFAGSRAPSSGEILFRKRKVE